MNIARRIAAALGVAAAAAVALCPAAAVHADDGIFPPAPGARAVIDFDGKGFIVRGERTFLASGSIHYPRVPRALWRDRLLRLKRAGFNTVETYAFWNYHETAPGKIDFTGEKDFGAFLKLAHELGLYAIVRVGPYICGEWDGGGYPAWLRFVPGVRVREDNPEYLKAVDRWFDALLPIVAANQINRGGAVVMVQLENEHPLGWGKEMPNGYFRHLLDKAHSAGLEVPLFFSGLHHGHDPAGNKPWDSANRTNPWVTTEFWPGWYDLYGPLDARWLRQVDRGTWKILAFGGNGYNFYMLHGGSNFGTTNNQEDASSYDYGAAIGQAGDLRPVYYRFKRANLFARSFADVLENSTNATDAVQNAATGEGVRIYGRQAPNGRIVFLDDSGTTPATAHLTSGTDITLHPGEIVPVLQNYRLAPSVTLTEAATRLLGIVRQGKTQTIVAYGPAGQTGRLRFSASADQVIDVTYPADDAAPVEKTFTAGDTTVRVLVLSEAQADRTWFAEAGGTNYVVVGPEYLEELTTQNGKLSLTAEHPVASTSLNSAWVYGPEKKAHRLMSQGGSSTPHLAVSRSTWEVRSGDTEAVPGFSDATWLASDDPLAMGADGDAGAFAWYRATATVPTAATYEMRLGAARDRVRIYVNGKPLPEESRTAGAASVPLQAGENHLAIFAAHYGRDKLFNYLGPLDTADVKGVTGAIALRSAPGSETPVARWRWRPATANESPEALTAENATGWQDGNTSDDIFHGRRGFAVYRATLDPGPAGEREIRFANVDDNATVYLNGTKIGTHRGWGQPFSVSLPATAWKADAPNVLTVLVENGDGGGGIQGAVSLRAYPPDSRAIPVHGWHMRGGIGDPDPAQGWQTLAAGTDRSGRSTFYRVHFSLTATPSSERTIRRISVTGLSRGFVWLNGHNLGRYPDKTMPLGLYLPECWLKTGENTLVIYDEDGASPRQAGVVTEPAASRFLQRLSE